MRHGEVVEERAANWRRGGGEGAIRMRPRWRRAEARWGGEVSVRRQGGAGVPARDVAASAEATWQRSGDEEAVRRRSRWQRVGGERRRDGGEASAKCR